MRMPAWWALRDARRCESGSDAVPGHAPRCTARPAPPLQPKAARAAQSPTRSSVERPRTHARARRPNPRSNFYGVINASTLAQVSSALASAAAAAAAACGAAPRPPLLTYSHYPLGLIASAPRPGMTNGGGRALAARLAAGGSAAHVSGHLHSLAGRFMYARHRTTHKQSAAAAGAGGVDAPASGPSLPEFELGDWKGARRWRLIAFDGPGVRAADFDYAGRRVRSLEPSAAVSGHRRRWRCAGSRRGWRGRREGRGSC